MESFRSEYSMKGWRSIQFFIFGLFFAAAGGLALFALKDREAMGFSWFLSVSFIAFGGTLAVYATRAYFVGGCYVLEVIGTVLRWERADLKKEIGRLCLTDVVEFTYIRGDESPDALEAIQSSGERIRIPIGYLDGNGARKRLFDYISRAFPSIRLIEK